jgi:hypothetical protein
MTKEATPATRTVVSSPSRYWGRWATILDALESIPEGQAVEVQTILTAKERGSLRYAAGWRGLRIYTSILPRSTVVWVHGRMERSYREARDRKVTRR